MVDLSVKIGGLSLRNPVMTASGTFGYGTEFEDFVNFSRMGGIIVKGTTIRHREGNAYPRLAEVPAGMLNAVGLQNKGVDYFCENIYPTVKNYDTNVIVNVSGASIEDYVATAEKINELEGIPGIELNISCPNVKQGGMAFGTSCSANGNQNSTATANSASSKEVVESGEEHCNQQYYKEGWEAACNCCDYTAFRSAKSVAGKDRDVYSKKTWCRLSKCDDVDKIFVSQPLSFYKF